MVHYLELQRSLQSRAEAKSMLPPKKLGGTLRYEVENTDSGWKRNSSCSRESGTGAGTGQWQRRNPLLLLSHHQKRRWRDVLGFPSVISLLISHRKGRWIYSTLGRKGFSDLNITSRKLILHEQVARSMLGFAKPGVNNELSRIYLYAKNH